VRLVQAHVHPSAVLLVPRLVGNTGALLQEGVGDLAVNVLLEHVLVCELYVTVEILQPGCLAKADELVVDEAILMLSSCRRPPYCLTLILYKVLDKRISADGNTKANVAVNYKGRGREQGTEVREGGIGNEKMRCAAACASSAEIPLTRILVLSKLRARPASSLSTLNKALCPRAPRGRWTAWL
jgi:hypothetical protein